MAKSKTTSKYVVTKVLDDDKDKAIGLALDQIERQFGKGSIMRLGESTGMDVDVIPTGAISLDAALGVGGVPRGRVVELFGPEAAGKTMCALHIVSEAQRIGGAFDLPVRSVEQLVGDAQAAAAPTDSGRRHGCPSTVVGARRRRSNKCVRAARAA